MTMLARIPLASRDPGMAVLVQIVLVLTVSLLLGIVSDVHFAPEKPAEPVPPLVLTIPKGSFSAALAGDPNAGLPKEITVRVGQPLVVLNNDVSIHYLMTQPVMPGKSATIVFDRPGKFAYSGGLSCSLTQEGATVITVVQ